MGNIMNARQQALFEYIRTIYPHVKGAKNVNDAIDRIMRCVREDSMFVLQGLTAGVIQAGKRFAEKQAVDTLEGLARSVGEFFGDLAKKRR
jgi:hypothetical protein